MSIEDALKVSHEAALGEIEEFGLPSLLHYSLSIDVGVNLARQMNADINIVRIGTSLMDFKLGEAFKNDKLNEHTKMSSIAAKELLAPYLDENILQIIIDCIDNHHGATTFNYIESEICANADCYRFIHPKGSLSYIATMGKRGASLETLAKQSLYKLEEKWAILSLDQCIKELEPYYKSLKVLIEGVR